MLVCFIKLMLKNTMVKKNKNIKKNVNMSGENAMINSITFSEIHDHTYTFDDNLELSHCYNILNIFDQSNEHHLNYIKNLPLNFGNSNLTTQKYDFVLIHDIKHNLDSHNKYIMCVHDDCRLFGGDIIKLYKENHKHIHSYIFTTLANKMFFENKVCKLTNAYIIENQINTKQSTLSITHDNTFVAVCDKYLDAVKIITEYLKSDIYQDIRLEIYEQSIDDESLIKLQKYTNNEKIKIIKYDVNLFTQKLSNAYGYVTFKKSLMCDYNLLEAIMMHKYVVCDEIYDNYEQIKYYPKKSYNFNTQSCNLNITYIAPEYMMEFKFLEILNMKNILFKKYVGKKHVTDNISEADLKDDITFGLSCELEKGLSFLLRVKNEEEYMLKNILSIYDYASEIIIIDNNSNDCTKNICRYLNNFYTKVTYYDYDIQLDFGTNPKYLNKLSTYYNWSLSKVTKYNVIKWDGDFYAIEHNLKKMINDYDLYERSDKFSLWFSGLTKFYNNVVNISSYYDEYRCFSKLNGFKWGDGYLCETSEFYVKECEIRLVNGFDNINNPVWLCQRAKQFDYSRRPIFIENKNYNDYKEVTLDKRCENDNNILLEFRDMCSRGKKEIYFIVILECVGIGGVETVNNMLFDQLTYVGHDVRFLVVRPSDCTDNIKYYNLVSFKNNIKTCDTNININILTFLDIFNENELKFLTEKKNINIYGISHSEVSYYNNYFVKNHKYFKNIIVVNNQTYNKYSLMGVTNMMLLRNVVPIKENMNRKIFDKKQIKILFFSRSSYDKNLIMLFYAIKKLGVNFVLDIYSDIDNTTKYYYDLMDCKNINIFNVTDNKNIYLDYDLCVLPSVSEGCSMNILESINYEVPIICTKIMANNEIIHDMLPMFEFDNIEQPNSKLFIYNYNEHLSILGYEFSNTNELKILTPYVTNNEQQIKLFEKNINEMVTKILLLTNNYDYYKTKVRDLKKMISLDFFDIKTYIMNINNMMSRNTIIVDREVA